MRTIRPKRDSPIRTTPDIMPMLRQVADRPGCTIVQNARMLAREWIAEYDGRARLRPGS